MPGPEVARAPSPGATKKVKGAAERHGPVGRRFYRRGTRTTSKGRSGACPDVASVVRASAVRSTRRARSIAAPTTARTVPRTTGDPTS